MKIANANSSQIATNKLKKLIIFDTTLRDGEQCPGASMDLAQKLEVAKALERLKVDVIEAGFPVTSPGDFASVQAIAKTIKNATICALARAVDNDIDIAAEALKPAQQMRMHTFIAASPIHMQRKLNMSPDQVVERAIAAVKRARRYSDDVEFSAEDAGRAKLDFLCRLLEQAIKAGATTINIPDTVGYTLPFQYGELIRNLIDKIPNADQAVFSTHCHNDLGMAVANSLAGVLNGARQVECTINGIGERAGNAALEEVVMAVKTRRDVFPCETGLDVKQLVPCSRLVSNITGFVVQRNKAIVGANAFAHEAGIHQDGIIKYRQTYEIMSAEEVGWDSNQLILGKHSGKSTLRIRLEILGFTEISTEQLSEIFQQFKLLADKHKIVDDKMLTTLAKSVLRK